MDIQFIKSQIHSTHYKTDEEARKILFNICVDLVEKLEVIKMDKNKVIIDMEHAKEYLTKSELQILNILIGKLQDHDINN